MTGSTGFEKEGRRKKKGRVAMTASWCNSAPAINGKLTEYSDDTERGLLLRVTSREVRSWNYRYRTGSGRQKRVNIGRLDVVSLKGARNEVIRLKAMIREGRDPAAEKQMEKRTAKQQRGRETIKELGPIYLELCKKGTHKLSNKPRPKKASTIRQDRYYFERILIPELGDLRPRDISRKFLQDTLSAIENEMAPSTARHAKDVLSGIFNFAVWQEYAEYNPCLFVSVSAAGVRKRFLFDDEIASLWHALDSQDADKAYQVARGTAIAIEFMLVTAQRRCEIASMRTSDIDWDNRFWLIPDTATKNSRPHVVPLSDLAIELIREALAVKAVDSPYVFPGRDPNCAIEPHSLTHAFARVRDAMGWEDVRLYDLRKTAATLMAKPPLKVRPFIISKVLNHTEENEGAAQVTSIYNLYDYFDEKQEALDGLARRIGKIIRPDPGAKVVKLSPALLAKAS